MNRLDELRQCDQLLGWVEQGQLGRAAAMGTVLIFSMLLVILLVLALARRLGSRMVEITP